MGSQIQSSGTESSVSIRFHRRSENGLPSSSENFSSSITDSRQIFVSTPIDHRIPFPRNKESPIYGSNRHMIKNSVNSENTVFSTNNTVGNSTQRRPDLEMVQVKHCGYAELSSTKCVSVAMKSNYPIDTFIEVRLDNEELAIECPFSVTRDFRGFILPSHETANIEIKFKPTREIFYSTKLNITANPNIPHKSFPKKKKYAMTLIGYGGVPSVRIYQQKVSSKTATTQSSINLRSTGLYDMRLNANKMGSFVLKNIGHRTAFVYIKALKISTGSMNQSNLTDRKEEFIPLSQVIIDPPYFILEKSSRRVVPIKITVVNSSLWKDLTAGTEEIRLSIYHGPERQRLRQARYARDRKAKVESTEGINFMRMDMNSDHNQEVDLPFTSFQDVAIFNQELRISFLRLLPPANSRPIGMGNDENFDPLGIPDDYLIRYDDDVVTVLPHH